MPASEIDDIFASRGKGYVVSKTAQVLPSLPEKKVKKKKNKKSSPVEEAQPASSKSTPSESKFSKKRSAPETVIDPSIQSVPKKRPKSVGSSKGQSKGDEERFKDSRGSGPRRKTEEGYSIYYEDELGISPRGGDTPSCPFDCDCCAFSCVFIIFALLISIPQVSEQLILCSKHCIDTQGTLYYYLI
ncbi:hypothetical protein BU15DRAFT_45434 [Melanogaster broomeanus]|nr:hypothetical protein BU15DRAFT_45434 [Melanogaster broomeanus]